MVKPHSPTAPDIMPEQERWAAVVARDPRADGQFVYAVKTTGVYAAPSSAARLPKRENVEFFDSEQAARQAGYRPSLRHGPDRSTIDRTHADIIAQACRQIESAATPLSLTELATAAGMSPHHFHRLFKTYTGMTPKAYGSGKQGRDIREALGQGTTITRAMMDAGFNASSRFYEKAPGMLGMTPRAFAQGGQNADIRFAVGESQLGAILVAASERGVCAILMGDDPHALVCELQDRFPHARLEGEDRDFDTLVAQVVGAIEAPAMSWTLPLDVRGTVFQQRVWQALREVTPGSTVSYADIAQRIGAPKAVRAVAGACAANWLAVAIPCHRVVRRDGALSGYRWGVERKRDLLAREKDQSARTPAPDSSRSIIDSSRPASESTSRVCSPSAGGMEGATRESDSLTGLRVKL